MEHLEYWATENILSQKAFVWLSWRQFAPTSLLCQIDLAGVHSCDYHPETKPCPPAVVPATVSALGDLHLWQFTVLWPMGWMDSFHLEFKTRSWSPFLLQALTNSAFISTEDGFADVAALAEFNPPKFTSYQEAFFCLYSLIQ